MRWEYIISSVVVFYLRAGCCGLAYFAAKFIVARKRSSAKPALGEKIFRYAACIAIISIIGFMAAYYDGDDEDDSRGPEPPNSNRGAIVFIALLIPALIGASEGFTTTDPTLFRDYGSSDREM